MKKGGGGGKGGAMLLSGGNFFVLRVVLRSVFVLILSFAFACFCSTTRPCVVLVSSLLLLIDGVFVFVSFFSLLFVVPRFLARERRFRNTFFFFLPLHQERSTVPYGKMA